MSVRAGIVVTGTEVLGGLIADANGPWLSEQLRANGVELSHTIVVGDRPDDLVAALDFFRDVDLVITSGGLGPTADAPGGWGWWRTPSTEGRSPAGSTPGLARTAD